MAQGVGGVGCGGGGGGVLRWQKSLLESFPLLRSSSSPWKNKWRLDVEMTKRRTERTGREGKRNALQMRWGNVAVVRWAAERVLPRFAVEVSITSCRLLYFLRLKITVFLQYFFLNM